MSPQLSLLLLIPLAYLVGSIPFGLLVGLAKGVDPRTAGSGNIGATNVARLLGRKFFFLVFFLDMLKSMVPMVIASAIVGRIPAEQRDAQVYLLWLAVGFAAILGHMFSVFLRFKGGKGVATSAGVMLGVFPDYTLAAIAVLVVFAICFAIWRTVSLGSVVAASAFPILYVAVCLLRGQLVLGERWPLLAF